MTENQEIAKLLRSISNRLAEMRTEYKAIMDGEPDIRGSHRSQQFEEEEQEDIAA